jgi:hypothetical protein
MREIIGSEVCIVVTGLREMTLMPKIIKKSFQVCLLERGDIECHQQTQSLYEGHKPQEIVFQNYRVYLGEGRICHNFATRFMYSSQSLAQTLTIFREYFTTSIQDLHIFGNFCVKEKYKPRYINSPKDE